MLAIGYVKNTVACDLECINASEIRNGIMFNFYPGLPHVHYIILQKI